MRALNGGRGEERYGEIMGIKIRGAGGRWRGADCGGAALGGLGSVSKSLSELCCSLADPADSAMDSCKQLILCSLLARVVACQPLPGTIVRSECTKVCCFVCNGIVDGRTRAVGACKHGRKGGVALGPADLDRARPFVEHGLPEGLPKVPIGAELERFPQLATINDAIGNGRSVIAISGDVHCVGGRHSNEQASNLTASAR